MVEGQIFDWEQSGMSNQQITDEFNERLEDYLGLAFAERLGTALHVEAARQSPWVQYPSHDESLAAEFLSNQESSLGRIVRLLEGRQVNILAFYVVREEGRQFRQHPLDELPTNLQGTVRGLKSIILTIEDEVLKREHDEFRFCLDVESDEGDVLLPISRIHPSWDWLEVID